MDASLANQTLFVLNANLDTSTQAWKSQGNHLLNVTKEAALQDNYLAYKTSS